MSELTDAEAVRRDDIAAAATAARDLIVSLARMLPYTELPGVGPLVGSSLAILAAIDEWADL